MVHIGGLGRLVYVMDVRFEWDLMIDFFFLFHE